MAMNICAAISKSMPDTASGQDEEENCKRLDDAAGLIAANNSRSVLFQPRFD
tara:strand:+ start:219 stop:374 length:156 start_codon:yes stop_codon:yes gene_type:complete